MAWFVDAREDRDDRRCLGSQDQLDQIFLAVHRLVLDDVQRDLTVNGERLLPRGLGWDDIGRDGLALFTQDSGGTVLFLR